MHRLSDMSIAIHSNSLAGSVNLLLTNDVLSEFEWISIEMSEILCSGKGTFTVILEQGLVSALKALSSHFRQLQLSLLSDVGNEEDCS